MIAVQLGGQLLVEELDDLGVALHRRGSFHVGELGRLRRIIAPVGEDRPVSASLVRRACLIVVVPNPGHALVMCTAPGLSGWSHGSAGGTREKRDRRSSTARSSAGTAAAARLAGHALRPRPQVPARALGVPGLRRHRRRRKHCWNHEEFTALPYTTVVADLHCVTKFSMLGAEWGGVPARTDPGARPARRRCHPCDGVGRVRLQRQPAALRLRRRAHHLRHPQGRRTAHRRARLPAPPRSSPTCTPGRARSGSAASST
ncbi:hypothetical protein SVIOM74S_10110 [Streptomyces violarus]